MKIKVIVYQSLLKESLRASSGVFSGSFIDFSRIFVIGCVVNL